MSVKARECVEDSGFFMVFLRSLSDMMLFAGVTERIC